MKGFTILAFIFILCWVADAMLYPCSYKSGHGWWNPCLCKKAGRVNCRCQHYTGICPCKSGYKGSKCQYCKPGYSREALRKDSWHAPVNQCVTYGYYLKGGGVVRSEYKCDLTPCFVPGLSKQKCNPNNGKCHCGKCYKGDGCKGCAGDCLPSSGGHCCPNGEYWNSGASKCDSCGCHPPGIATTKGRICPQNGGPSTGGSCKCGTGYGGPTCSDCTSISWKVNQTCIVMPTYDDSSPGVTDIPFLGKCAVDGHTLRTKVDYLHVYSNVGDMAKCSELCDQYPECVYYIIDDGDCLIVGRISFSNLEYTKLAINGPDKCPLNGGECIKIDTLYYSPHIQTQDNVESPYECQKLCRKKSGCKFFVYSMVYKKTGSDNKKCFLKNHNLGTIYTGTQGFGSIIAKKYVSGAARCSDCFWPMSTLNLLPNIKDENGNAYVTTQTHVECQSRCRKRKACEFFEWHRTTKRCFMKNARTVAIKRKKAKFAKRGCNLNCGNCNPNGVRNKGDLSCDSLGNCKCKPYHSDRLCEICMGGYKKDSGGNCILKSG